MDNPLQPNLDSSPSAKGDVLSAPKRKDRRCMPGLPFAALVRREMIVTLRGRVLFGMLVVLLAVLVLCINEMWPEKRVVLAGFGAQLSNSVYILYCLIMLASAAMLMPGLGAAAIASERDTDTYDQLRLTLLRPAGVLLGKLLNTAGVFLLFYAATFPVLGAVMFLVGLEWSSIVAAAVVIVATAITCALLGMAAASLTRRTVPAAVLAYLFMLVYMGASFIPVFVAAIFIDSSPAWRFFEKWVMSLTPAGVLVDSSGFGRVSSSYMPFALYSGAFCLASYLLVWWRLNKPLAQEETPASRFGKRRSLTHCAKPPMADSVNPMFLREVRYQRRRLSRLKATLVFASVFALVNSFIILQTSVQSNGVDTFLSTIVLQLVLLVAVAPAYGANMLTKESDYGSLDLLRSCLISPHGLVWGKACAVCVQLAPLCLGLILGSLPFLVEPDGVAPLVWMGWGAIVLSAAMAASVSILAGSVAHRTALAVAMAYGCVAFAFGLYAPILDVLLSILDFPRGSYRDRILVFFSPLTSFVQVVEELRRGQFWQDPGYATGQNRLGWLWLWASASAYQLLFSVAGIEAAVYVYKRRCRFNA